MKKTAWLILLITLSCYVSVAQNMDDNVNDLSEFEIRFKMQELDFLKPDSVAVFYDSLSKFYSKLSALKNEGKGVVNVVHIGDSHVQAGYFTGVLRRGLQSRYGNAGRGIIFPYRLAKTNGPADYVSSSFSPWSSVRNVFADDSFPSGITGFAIKNYEMQNSFCIKLRNNEGMNYDFSHLQLFTNSNINSVVTVTDSLTGNSAKLDNAFVNNFQQSYSFSSLCNNFCIETKSTDSVSTTLYYGVSLSNDSLGILCHTIGVNGAEYRHYLHQPKFWEQLTALNADLVIVSLGTNEAMNRSLFNRYTFIQNVDSVVKNIRQYAPNADIIITSPAESCIRVKKRRYTSNPNVLVIRNVLNEYCSKNKIGFFDLYTCAGGKGSMLKYAAKGMSDKRRIHFNRTGYEMHGTMLLDAILKNTDTNP